MKSEIKVAIVGSGSSYTPELIEGILARAHDTLPITHISMFDVDRRRQGIMAGLTERMINAAGRKIKVDACDDLDRSLAGADFVITQIRVGGMEARHIDETVPLKYGVIGQETTGPGGMFKALRTIPVIVNIAKAVERVCPDAFILNYTNPSGIVTEAVLKHTRAKFIGLCAGIPAIQDEIRQRLAGTFGNLKTYCVGLNHVGFIHRILSDGRDVTRQAIDHLAEQDKRASEDNRDMARMDLARILGAIPIGYVNYFYHQREKIAKAKGQLTRAQQVMGIEKDVFLEAANPSLSRKPDALKRRGGEGYSEITFSFMKAILHNSGEELVASVTNNGAVDMIDNDASVELVCRVDNNGAVPLKTGEIPLAFRALVQSVKAYETLTVDAGMARSRRLALLAFTSNPLVLDIDIASKMLDEMLSAHNLEYVD
jgi:6-phospho-beta-glucosidase